jgi:hypothetical protein
MDTGSALTEDVYALFDLCQGQMDAQFKSEPSSKPDTNLASRLPNKVSDESPRRLTSASGGITRRYRSFWDPKSAEA